jgi:hypothetical protein
MKAEDVSTATTLLDHLSARNFVQAALLHLFCSRFSITRFGFFVLLTPRSDSRTNPESRKFPFQRYPNQLFFSKEIGALHFLITQEKAVALIKDVFTSAGERDIYTGANFIDT